MISTLRGSVATVAIAISKLRNVSKALLDTSLKHSLLAFSLLPLLAIAGPTVTDDLGNTISLDSPATRIISLAPHNTENLYSAGAGDRVVGVVEYSDYPEAALDLPSVGSHVQFNLEAIIGLQPDLVVAWRSGNNAEALKRIESFGIPVYYSEPHTFDEVADNILDLGILSGTEDSAAGALDGALDRIDTLRDQYTESRQLRVFYQIWTNPLMTLNGDHFVTGVLEVCGAINLFADLPIIAPQVNMESVIKANPDVIVTGMTDNIPPDMTLWAQWDSVTAVREDHFVYVDSDIMHRHTLRMLNGIASVCTSLDEVRQRLGD